MVRSDARSPAILAPGTPTAGNITSVGWQVTLCDPIWHVSSRSGVATLRTAIHLLLLLAHDIPYALQWAGR